MSRSRTGTKRSLQTKINMSMAQSGKNNPMYNKHHLSKSKQQIGDSLRGKYVAERNSRFVGYYVTPYGKFATVKEIANNIKNISQGTVFKWCKNSDNRITKNMIGISKYLTLDMLGKSFREIGFYMETK
jgi:hypothetical protein